jgi:mitochondrial GTPase 1
MTNLQNSSMPAEPLQHLITSSTFPTNDIYHFLTDLALRLGALRRGGEPDLNHAAHFFVRMYRDGKFGNWSLDDLGSEEEVEKTVLALLKRQPVYSATQARKKKKAEMARKRLVKRKVRNVRP